MSPLQSLESDARHAGTVACTALRSGDACLPCTLVEAAGDAPPMGAMRKVRRGAALFRDGDPFRSLYVVRYGTFKTVIGGRDGRDQVTGFQIAGELLGHDGLAEDRHSITAVALEDSEVVELPRAVPPGAPTGLEHAVTLLLSREIVREHKLMLLLASMDADQRLASFLLNYSRRMEARVYSGTEFRLRMTRGEIASYLGLSLETVSRTFSSFEQRGFLKVRGRHVLAVDRDALRRMFGSRHARKH
jgi:CRP/FNR family transcriptional regulator